MVSNAVIQMNSFTNTGLGNTFMSPQGKTVRGINQEAGINIRTLCVHSVTQPLSHVQLFVTPWTHRAATLSMGFFRQGNWNRLPFPPPRVLPDPGVEPKFPASLALVGRFFTSEPPGKLPYIHYYI